MVTVSGNKQGHDYKAHLTWEGNLGEGTATYAGYGRQYRVSIAGKPDLGGSADPAFRGDPEKHNPEDLLLAAISSCHMLSYLALCARARIAVVAYEDEATGTMMLEANGGGRFVEVTLHPVVTLAPGSDVARAERFHETAHGLCFIANSCNFPIRHEAIVRVGA
jgi:organic hydroperoxide reductase OsmC/OhrA